MNAGKGPSNFERLLARYQLRGGAVLSSPARRQHSHWPPADAPLARLKSEGRAEAKVRGLEG